MGEAMLPGQSPLKEIIKNAADKVNYRIAGNTFGIP
jgi:hypothetical protein